VYKKIFKRVMDVVLSCIALIVFMPVILAVALLVRIKLGSPVIFKQKRPGKAEVIFTMYKFRTMTDKRGENGELLPDTERLTAFGRFLRSTSLDELPELLNILKGDMSIVGPRPLLVQYISQYNEFERRRHEARPGLTGLAQINGRNATTWDERFQFDVKYVDNISLKQDMKIIRATVIKVFKREGVSAENSETMEIFVKREME